MVLNVSDDPVMGKASPLDKELCGEQLLCPADVVGIGQVRDEE